MRYELKVALRITAGFNLVVVTSDEAGFSGCSLLDSCCSSSRPLLLAQPQQVQLPFDYW